MGKRKINKGKNGRKNNICFVCAEDDLFADLKCAFLAKGRGARKQIKGLTFNHKLMLQMCLLRDEAGKTWSDTEMFLQKFCGEVPPHRIKTVIESSVRAAEKITSASDSEIAAFFQTKVVIQPPEVGPFAADIGLNAASLKDCCFSVFCSRPTNGLILELETLL